MTNASDIALEFTASSGDSVAQQDDHSACNEDADAHDVQDAAKRGNALKEEEQMERDGELSLQSSEIHARNSQLIRQPAEIKQNAECCRYGNSSSCKLISSGNNVGAMPIER